MKHIYKFSIVLLAVFTFIGCNVDDDDAITVLPMKELTASFDKQVNVIAVADDATSYDLVIKFSEALPSYSTVEYSLDGGVTTLAASSQGDNSLVIPISFAATENSHTVSVSDFIVVNAAARRFTTNFTGNTTVQMVRQGYFSAKMTWEGGQDLDLLFGTMSSGWAPGILLDSSEGVTNEENVSGSQLEDGNYGMLVYEWPNNTFSQPVDITFDVVTAGGTFTLTKNALDFGFHWWGTKSTDADGNVSWTMYTEDPS